MNIDEATSVIKQNYDVLRREYSISRIGFFGSITKNAMTENSDLDIVVEFNKPIGFKFIRLVEYLENLFGEKVDVLTKDGIENIRVKEIIGNIKRDLTYV